MSDHEKKIDDQKKKSEELKLSFHSLKQEMSPLERSENKQDKCEIDDIY